MEPLKGRHKQGTLCQYNFNNEKSFHMSLSRDVKSAFLQTYVSRREQRKANLIGVIESRRSITDWFDFELWPFIGDNKLLVIKANNNCNRRGESFAAYKLISSEWMSVQPS
jgi:hypothetical protein